MKTSTKLLIIIQFLFLVEACKDSPQEQIQNASTSDSVIASENADEDGPPFKNECEANFTRFGVYKISNTNFNIYYSGKGWNSNLDACTWTWSEIVNNEFPDDTNVTSIKIHLLDLEKFSFPVDGSDYGHDSIKNYVISIYSRSSKGGEDNYKYDPFNTGKYPEPK